MTDQADAIVVGSGINGLVSAAELARAGWSVILLERNAEIGGFIATEERTLPGYLHDTFSSWHPLFVSGPAYAALGELLQRHGLETGTPTAGSLPAWPTTAVPRSPTGSNARRRNSPMPKTGPSISPYCNGWARHGVNRRPAGQRGAFPRGGAARERSGPQRRVAAPVVATRCGHQRPGVPAPGFPRT